MISKDGKIMFSCLACKMLTTVGPYCGCINRNINRSEGMSKPEEGKAPDQIFELADKMGVKEEMLSLIKFCLAMHKGEDPMKIQFGPEELFCGMHTGLQDAGVPANFQFRSRFALGRAHLFGYLLGRMIMKESENKNVEASNKT
jgi:hypothetical protein